MQYYRRSKNKNQQLADNLHDLNGVVLTCSLKKVDMFVNGQDEWDNVTLYLRGSWEGQSAPTPSGTLSPRAPLGDLCPRYLPRDTISQIYAPNY